MNSRNRIYAYVAVLFSAGFLFTAPFSSHDLWWHLLEGKVIVTENRIIGEDLFSYMGEGEYYHVYAPVFNAGLYLALRSASPTVLSLVTFLLAAATCAAAAVLVWNITQNRNWTLWSALLSAYVFHDLQLRPDAFNPLMLVLYSWALVSCLRNPPDWKRWAALPLLLTVWVNIHPLAYVMMGISLAAFTGCAMYRTLAGMKPGVVVALVFMLVIPCLIHPDPFGNLDYAMDGFRNNKQWATEWMPRLLSFSSLYSSFADDFIYLNVILLVLYVHSLFYQRYKFIRYDFVAIDLLCFYFYFHAYRIGFVLLLAWFLALFRLYTLPQETRQDALERIPLMKPDPAFLIYLLCFAILLVSQKKIHFHEDGMPREAGEFLQRVEAEGNLFCLAHNGFELAYYGYPKMKVYADLRSQVFEEATIRQPSAFLHDPVLFYRHLKEYDVKYAVLGKNDPLNKNLVQVGDWKVISSEGSYFVYRLDETKRNEQN